MLCRIEMPSNEQTYGRFYRYMLFKGSDTSARNNFALSCAVGVLTALFALGMGMQFYITLLILAAVVAYAVYMLYVKPGQAFRKKEGAALQTEVYIFSNANFTRSLRSEEGGLPENTFTRYDGLLKAVETSKDFYFFTGQTQAYAASKEYFTNGSAEELRQLLKKVMGKRFATKQ